MLKGASRQNHMRDMTKGKPLHTIIAFAIPLTAGSMIQQLFSLADAMILGIFGGNEGLAILGTCSWPIWFQISVLTAFGQAACLLAAVRFGAKDEGGFKSAVGNIYLISIVTGIVLTLGFQWLVIPLLKFQNTPSAVMEEAVQYLRILYGGTVFLLLYNMLASLLRSVGDSYTSFIAITISAFLNIALDIVLVAGFHMGVKGAAIGTVAAQSVAALICIKKIWRYKEFRIGRKNISFDKSIMKEYVSLCLPMVTQSLVIAMGGIFVQHCVNRYGVFFAAGISAAESIFSVVETGAVALAQACATFVSQNVGAKQYLRIQKAVRQACVLAVSAAVGIGGILLLFGPGILTLYVKGEALQYAVSDMTIISFGLIIMYPMYSLRQTVQALGNLWIPLIAGVLQLALRILTAWYLPMLIGYQGLFYTNIAAWLVSLLLIGVIYPAQLKKCQGKENNV